MKLLSLLRDGQSAIGVLADEETVVDLSVAAPDVPRGMCRFLAAGEEAMAAARDAAEAGAGRVPLADQTLLAPVPRPRKFLAIGLNYADHAAETGQKLPEFPTVFNKQVTCVNRPGGAIHIPRASSAVDYEGEFAFVIGRRCRGVAAEDAAAAIAGYTIVNDVSVRDWQRRSPTMILGKGWDTHGPMGPYLVTADEVEDREHARHPHLGQRRAAAGLEHPGTRLRLPEAGRDDLDHVHARTRRRGDHRHSGRRRHRPPAAEVPGARRRRADRDRRTGGAREPGDRRTVDGRFSRLRAMRAPTAAATPAHRWPVQPRPRPTASLTSRSRRPERSSTSMDWTSDGVNGSLVE